MNVDAYYKKLKETRVTLTGQYPSGYCHIVSLDNPERNTTAGAETEATVEIAAENLTKGTHRLMTDAEVEKYRAEMAGRRDKAEKDALAKRGGQTILVVNTQGAELPTTAIPAPAPVPVPVPVKKG